MDSSRSSIGRASNGEGELSGASPRRVSSSGLLVFWRKCRLLVKTAFRDGKSTRTTERAVEAEQGDSRKSRNAALGGRLRSSSLRKQTEPLDGPRRGGTRPTKVTLALKERSRGLEVLQVVLSHAKLGQPWYVSMGDMQLACVDTCLACRRRSKWNVRVTEATPGSLWLRHERDLYRRQDIAMRVPLLRVYSITWDLPEAARILRGSPLFEPEPSQEGKVRLVATEWWPRTLREIRFGDGFDDIINGVLWPDALKQLTFGRKFNQEISRVNWPRDLETLTFGSFFDQPIQGTELPDSLQYLTFGVSFNQKVEDVSWPVSLRELSFGHRFNQPIESVVWPDSLRHLKFDWGFNVAISRVQWPPRLETIVFGDCFD
ncbi:unnamed protein product, partial [Ascophyllum nodosum]